jgi:hypothetical protein
VQSPHTLLKVTMILYIICGVISFLLMLSDAFVGVIALAAGNGIFGSIVLLLAVITALTSILMVIAGIKSLQGSYGFGKALTVAFIISGIVQFVGFLCVQQIDASLVSAVGTVVLPLLFLAGIKKSEIA